MYREIIRNKSVELKDTHIENLYEYDGHTYVKLSKTGVEHIKTIFVEPNTDIRYLIIVE